LKFRHDINGLRAIAVVGVVLFHFNPAWIPGGFAGVDVFFVISGFLMTGIIFKGIEQKSFSITKFYIARANRIIPALAFLCLALLVFGWFSLTPIDYKLLAKHAISSISFISNIVYWSEAGYFDVSSHSKWLLHTWSLSVEWQFYIIYPLVLLFISRFCAFNVIKTLIVVGTIVGFLFSVFASFNWSSAAYFLLPTRAWEMMLGGVAYLFPLALDKSKKLILERIGLLLILGSYFVLSDKNVWPGYAALMPVMGTYFVIQAARNDSFITRNFISQKLGAWSYSIYLWHWPIVVGIYYYNLDSYYVFLGIFTSILLGHLSYLYIEYIRFESTFINFKAYLTCKPLYIALSILVLSFLVIHYQGNNYWFNSLDKTRMKTYSLLFERDKEKDNWGVDAAGRQDFDQCHFNNVTLTDPLKARLKSCVAKNGPGVLILGDSHSEDLFGMVSSSFGSSFIIGITNTQGCRPHTETKYCQIHYSAIKQFLFDNPTIFKHVIYEQAGFYLFLDKNGVETTRETFNKLALDSAITNIDINKRYLKHVHNYLAQISKQIPVTWFGSRIEPHFNDRQVLSKGCDFTFSLRPGQRALYELLDKEMQELVKQQDNIKFVSQNETLRFDFNKDFMNCDKIYWTDGDHLSLHGEEYLGKRLPETFLFF
jgi:peptidoglycan/LPS O-acetylase OafA/YrhL